MNYRINGHICCVKLQYIIVFSSTPSSKYNFLNQSHINQVSMHVYNYQHFQFFSNYLWVPDIY